MHFTDVVCRACTKAGLNLVGGSTSHTHFGRCAPRRAPVVLCCLSCRQLCFFFVLCYLCFPIFHVVVALAAFPAVSPLSAPNPVIQTRLHPPRCLTPTAHPHSPHSHSNLKKTLHQGSRRSAPYASVSCGCCAPMCIILFASCF
ncbi:hypothetical protein JB92DRAFT_12580 [Gautieria morchelliformis]|nr:hypothetical protein JB92DRAFT_12580 [Gautieria morchelliformis]